MQTKVLGSWGEGQEHHQEELHIRSTPQQDMTGQGTATGSHLTEPSATQECLLPYVQNTPFRASNGHAES